MSPDTTPLSISATKPGGTPARRLADLGITIVPIADDEGNVDRYVLSKRLAIERRTASAFLRGIQEKTLFTSAIYLREHFRLPILIVEGQTDYGYSGFSPQAVRGALSSMMLLYGINVLATPDVGETVALIAMIARQEQIGIPEISLIPKRKAIDLNDLQRRLIEMLPGSGMVMARQMLQHFGSVRRIVEATEDELRALRGIGARKAKQILKVLAAEYEAVDTERDLEDAIEARPALLFGRSVALVARQHHIYTDDKQRHVVDMVFSDPTANELVLVELKRGRLAHDHVAQLRRYLDRAAESKLLRPFLDRGVGLRGVLATCEPCTLKVPDPAITTHIVDRAAVLAVLKALRDHRLATMAAARR